MYISSKFPKLSKYKQIFFRQSHILTVQSSKNRFAKPLARIAALFLFSFLVGEFTAHTVENWKSSKEQEVSAQSAEGNWGLSFQQEGKPPVANASMEYLKQFNAFYAQDTQEKVLYLTFDAGYENGNTAAILDALKKHNAPATFFLVGNYLETSPDLVKRMLADT